MKVLFAVSSENISEAIIKRYQKEYKEILSYKNVYYFNAILKEIQKDKTYDRIIISEDLEPFSNNNYDTIDKFIFEKLDSISDEAQDSSGHETSIILICTDRRVKGNSILVKLFGIGVYNALLGNDRSMEQVCKLIKKPRTKKEAKIYYQIDSDDVSYKAENENEVSEVEIQNILAHFRKLGRNTAKYSDSFNNIAIQYTDEQLKIIVNCLPINVKATLEANCERYQQLMTVTGGIASVKSIMSSQVEVEGIIKNEISERKIGQAEKITKPIVIPSAVKSVKRTASPVVKKAPTAIPEQVEPEKSVPQRPVVRQAQSTQPVKQAVQQVTPKQTTMQVKEVKNVPVKNNMQEKVVMQNPNTNGTVQETSKVKVIRREESIKPERILVEEQNIVSNEELEDASVKRGRGRPRKTPIVGAEVKPKGKRGRPKKIVEEISEIDTIDEIMLPGMEEEYVEENVLPGMNEEYVEEIILPGMEEEYVEEDMLPGMEEEYVEEDMLPGMEEEHVEEDMLSGMEEEYVEEDMLPGMEEEYVEEDMLPEVEDYEEEDMLPGMEEEYVEEDILPGMEEEYVEEDILPEVEDYEEELIYEDEYTEEVALDGLDDLDDFAETLPDFEEYEEVDEDEDMLPIMNVVDTEEELLPSFSDMNEDIDSSEEETLLPGMGFEDEETIDEMIPQRNNNVSQEYDSNSLESIKPRVDYSMSSLNSLITKDKKIVTFIGTSKNGTSFLVNNLAALFSSLGINTAILDMTQNKNSYYIYTKNEEELRNIAFNSIEKLQNGYAEGIRVDKNLTVYTALPNDGKDYSNAEPILSTLVQNHSLVLIDCDYETDISYFASCQEMYLVQSMDILTIQPLTAFLRELKTRGVLEPEKIRVVVNKELKVKNLSIKAIIGGLSYYNDPAMSFMTELFNKDIVKACTIPFEEIAYSKYLEGIVNCNISLNGYSKAKAFLSKLKILGDMVYPLTSKQSYNKTSVDYNKNAFSNSMNDTLNKMRKKY